MAIKNTELSENVRRIIDQNKKRTARKKSKDFYFYENFSLEKYDHSLKGINAFFNEVLPEAKNISEELNNLGENSVKFKKTYGDEAYIQKQCTLIERRRDLLKEKLVPLIKTYKITSNKDFDYVIKKTDSTKSSMEIISVFGIEQYELCELYAINKAEAEETLNNDYDVYPVEFLRRAVDFNISKNNINGNMLKSFLMFIYPEHKDKILEMATETCKKFMQKFPVCHHVFNEHYHDLSMPYSVSYLPKNQELNIE